jgi:ADP-L-glycero-D-manno-heptose 6-epimerase
MTPRLVLVTGGAGFIGSNIVAELAADPALDIAVCDRLHEADLGKWRNLAKHSIADFVQPQELPAWLESRGAEVEAVIHMGAISSTLESDVDKIIGVNFGLSRDLFGWCARHGRRFIWASSAATYGDGTSGFQDDDSLEALAALRPLNAYGWSKALFDVHARREALRRRAPPQWAGLKFFNVYGPNEGHKGPMRSVATKIWPDVAAGRPVKLFKSHRQGVTDGGQKRDFIFVDDVAKAVAWLFRRGDVSGVFNLGSGAARSFADLATAVFQAAGREPDIEYVEMPAELRGQYQYFTQAPMERLRAVGYTAPFKSLEDGVADYVKRFLATSDPYR